MEMPTASAADAVPRPSPSPSPSMAPPPAVVDPASSSSSSSANANVVSANVDNNEEEAMMMAVNNSDDAYSRKKEKFDTRVRMSKYINFGLYLLTTMIVLGVMYVGVPAYGVFGDDYLWMKYQVR